MLDEEGGNDCEIVIILLIQRLVPLGFVQCLTHFTSLFINYTNQRNGTRIEM